MYCNKTPLLPVVFLDIGCLCVFDAERKWGVHPSSPAVRVPSSRERPKTTDRQDLEMSVPGAAWDRGTGVGPRRGRGTCVGAAFSTPGTTRRCFAGLLKGPTLSEKTYG